nr:hypothetical protein [Tanacetum cinerariifolium]
VNPSYVLSLEAESPIWGEKKRGLPFGGAAPNLGSGECTPLLEGFQWETPVNPSYVLSLEAESPIWGEKKRGLPFGGAAPNLGSGECTPLLEGFQWETPVDSIGSILLLY